MVRSAYNLNTDFGGRNITGKTQREIERFQGIGDAKSVFKLYADHTHSSKRSLVGMGDINTGVEDRLECGRSSLSGKGKAGIKRGLPGGGFGLCCPGLSVVDG
jgi:hypothetical protein